jgi:hypothetical protein
MAQLLDVKRTCFLEKNPADLNKKPAEASQGGLCVLESSLAS